MSIQNKIIYKTQNFVLTKESEDFYGIYEKYFNKLKTHKTSKTAGIKMCKLLQYAYDLAIEEISYNEQMNSYR